MAKRVSAGSAPATDSPAPRGFAQARGEAEAEVCADDAAARRGAPEFDREAAKRSVGECAHGMARTKGVESFRSMPKRGGHGTRRHPGEKRLARRVAECAGHRNVRDFDTKDRMATSALAMTGEKLRCVEPIP